AFASLLIGLSRGLGRGKVYHLAAAGALAAAVLLAVVTMVNQSNDAMPTSAVAVAGSKSFDSDVDQPATRPEPEGLPADAPLPPGAVGEDKFGMNLGKDKKNLRGMDPNMDGAGMRNKYAVPAAPAAPAAAGQGMPAPGMAKPADAKPAAHDDFAKDRLVERVDLDKAPMKKADAKKMDKDIGAEGKKGDDIVRRAANGVMVPKGGAGAAFRGP